MKKAILAIVVMLQMAICGAVAACNIPAPSGDVILVVDGMINACNQTMEVHFDRAMLDALPQHTIKTENPWEEGQVTYEGVLLRDLMDHVKADGKVAMVAALNDYRAEIPVQDFATYDIILASKRNGVELPVRDKGPLFVVFPFVDNPDLKTEARYAQSVWQVNRISVK